MAIEQQINQLTEFITSEENLSIFWQQLMLLTNGSITADVSAVEPVVAEQLAAELQRNNIEISERDKEALVEKALAGLSDIASSLFIRSL